MTEKKKTTAKTKTKAGAEQERPQGSPEESAAKKPAAKKPAVKKAAPKAAKAVKKEASARPDIRKEMAEKREVQEQDSIAPPSKSLVSAFSIFKKPQRPAAQAPTIARIAPGGSLPKPPAPPAVSSPAQASPAAPLPGQAAPVPPRPGVPASPQPVAGPAAPPAVRPGVVPPKAPVAPPRPGVVPPAKPPVPGAPPVARPPGPGVPPASRPGVPPSRPGAPPFRPGAPPSRPGMPPAARPSARPAAPPAAKPAAPRPGAPAAKPAGPSVPERPPLKKIKVASNVTLREFAEKMEVKSSEVISKLMKLGIFATINQRLETAEASIVAQEFGYELEVVAMYKEEELAVQAGIKDAPEKLKPRPPVVTVMGHVDHGKTSLLDAIRSTNVAAGESGQITQHIGAYRVATAKGDVVFLDTPGHAAFTAMRARGAKVTDIVILVVSAADGVMPQTVEAIDHAKAAGVPIIVAVNKIDLPTANPQKIRQELSQYGLLSEEWGGKTIFVDLSAKKRVNIEGLLEMVGLQAMMMELKANPDRPAYGVILESKMDAKKGTVATVLVQTGTLKVGNAFVGGLAHGKVKALLDDRGKRLIAAGPSLPVEVLGIMGAPQAGDSFAVVDDERQARDIAEKRRIVAREQALAHQQHVSLVGLRSAVKSRAVRDLNIVLKADVHGSLQAIKDSLETLSTSECRVRAIHAGLGNVNESDILLASASNAVALLFHTEIEPRAQELAARDGVEVRKYEIIYELIEDVRAALEGLLEPEIVDVIVGRGEVLQAFSVKDGGKVAGVAVRDGKVVRNCLAKLIRNNAVVCEGKVVSLKRFKDDAKEVEKGLECGLSLEGSQDYKKGDLLEFIVKETRTRRLSDSAKGSS
ncbi:MAG: translation initiation factor IF-2 [Elusimicrobia bacterium]|nr:translation initiation factor IF-2 [Elusimicrobiota bacterium]